MQTNKHKTKQKIKKTDIAEQRISTK